MLRAYNHSTDDYHLDFSDSLSSAKIIMDIFKDAAILQNAIERSMRTGQTLESVGGSVASFDHLYLPRLHRAGFVANDTADIIMPSRPLSGGYVLEPAPGLYNNVLVFDFKSLYPSIIMTFMIDPLGFRVINGDDDKITTPIGTSFSKTNSILPEIIRELMAGRAAAIEQKNPYLSTAIKLLMNSFAGVLGSTGCRFFSEHVSGSITKTGQHILKISIERIEQISGKKVIYGDTDSLFLNLEAGTEEQAEELGKSISKEMGIWLRNRLKENFGVTSALELKFECHFRRFFIPSLRNGGEAGQGTKKHYCGAVVGKDGEMELTFKGMESARSDWTDLAKEFQRELFIKFFSGQPLDDYIIDITGRLRRGEFDDKLVYKKRMRKSIGSYTANVPPHVQAAKLLDAPIRLVKYYITRNSIKCKAPRQIWKDAQRVPA
jgi:DNA polymerase-2